MAMPFGGFVTALAAGGSASPGLVTLGRRCSRGLSSFLPREDGWTSRQAGRAADDHGELLPCQAARLQGVRSPAHTTLS